jgi:hypothetical protein
LPVTAEYKTLPFHLDHIISKKHGGTDDESNLALCCPECNRHKGPNIATLEPETDNFVGFFNPRKEQWSNHFRFENGFITGLTLKGPQQKPSFVLTNQYGFLNA